MSQITGYQPTFIVHVVLSKDFTTRAGLSRVLISAGLESVERVFNDTQIYLGDDSLPPSAIEDIRTHLKNNQGITLITKNFIIFFGFVETKGSNFYVANIGKPPCCAVKKIRVQRLYKNKD